MVALERLACSIHWPTGEPPVPLLCAGMADAIRRHDAGLPYLHRAAEGDGFFFGLANLDGA
jgi:hypothetical protein